jgi:hypothetical protein
MAIYFSSSFSPLSKIDLQTKHGGYLRAVRNHYIPINHHAGRGKKRGAPQWGTAFFGR